MTTRLVDRRPAAVLLVVLLSTIPLFLLAHAGHRAGWPLLGDHRRFDVDRDRSFIEAFGYLQALTAGLLLWRLWWRCGSAPVHLMWALALVVLFIDDALEIHERGGRFLAGALELQPRGGLRAVDFGELMMFAAIGTALAVGLLAAHVRSDAQARCESRVLGGVLALLAIPALAIDMLDIALQGRIAAWAVESLVQAEAAGELAVFSLALSWAVHMSVRRRPAPISPAEDTQPTVAPTAVPTR